MHPHYQQQQDNATEPIRFQRRQLLASATTHSPHRELVEPFLLRYDAERLCAFHDDILNKEKQKITNEDEDKQIKK